MMNLIELQRKVDEWIKNNGGYWSPLAMLASVTEELGEVAREINHLEKIKIKKDSEDKTHLDVELGDILFSIICIANHYDINLDNAFEKTMKKYIQRDKKRFKT
ncbi:MAG: nucleotide pyrophosphohydrolase [archaeon]|nr:nucleotide pyrophosphohydrolase [archaeon]